MKTITTVEELEALPEGAIILDGGSPGSKRGESFIFADNPGLPTNTAVSLKAWQLANSLPATLIHPLAFDAADVERAARALAEARYEGCPLEDLADIHLAEMLDQARAVLGAVGSVEA